MLRVCYVYPLCLLNGITETIQVTTCRKCVPLGSHVGQPCYAALSGSIYKWRCVLCGVGTEFLYTVHMNVSIPRVYKNQLQNMYWIISKFVVQNIFEKLLVVWLARVILCNLQKLMPVGKGRRHIPVFSVLCGMLFVFIRNSNCLACVVSVLLKCKCVINTKHSEERRALSVFVANLRFASPCVIIHSN
jgi:hypothetical protein